MKKKSYVRSNCNTLKKCIRGRLKMLNDPIREFSYSYSRYRIKRSTENFIIKHSCTRSYLRYWSNIFPARRFKTLVLNNFITTKSKILKFET